MKKTLAAIALAGSIALIGAVPAWQRTQLPGAAGQRRCF